MPEKLALGLDQFAGSGSVASRTSAASPPATTVWRPTISPPPAQPPHQLLVMSLDARIQLTDQISIISKKIDNYFNLIQFLN